MARTSNGKDLSGDWVHEWESMVEEAFGIKIHLCDDEELSA